MDSKFQNQFSKAAVLNHVPRMLCISLYLSHSDHQLGSNNEMFHLYTFHIAMRSVKHAVLKL